MTIFNNYMTTFIHSSNICECRKWQLSGIPCGHVIAVTRYMGLTDCLQYVQDWFKKEKYQATYAESIQFVGNFHEWEYPSHIHPITPPKMDNPQAGRPKNKDRIRSQGEEPKTMYCTRCKEAGHNRQRCNKSYVPDLPVRKRKQKQQEFPTDEQRETAPSYDPHHMFDQSFMGNNQFSSQIYGQNTYPWHGQNTYTTNHYDQNQYHTQTFDHNQYTSQAYYHNLYPSQTTEQHHTQSSFNLSQQNPTYTSQAYQQYDFQQYASQHLDNQHTQDSNSWFNRLGF